MLPVHSLTLLLPPLSLLFAFSSSSYRNDVDRLAASHLSSSTLLHWLNNSRGE